MNGILSLSYAFLSLLPDGTQYKVVVSKQGDAGTVNRKSSIVKNTVPRNTLSIYGI